MDISAIEQMLLKERTYWQRLTDYAVEPTSMDPQSNITFDVATKTMTTIDRALKRIKAGVYGRCEKCGNLIDPERLETLITSDCHFCADCANISKAQMTFQAPRPNSHSVNRHAVPAM